MAVVHVCEHTEDPSIGDKALAELHQDIWSTTTGCSDTEDAVENVSNLASSCDGGETTDHPVLTVDPAMWDAKIYRALEAGSDEMFWVCDFDRTVTKCFLGNGQRSLDCHDILASIPKITPECKEAMESMMAYYYPIEIHPTMSREEKIPYMVEWYTKVNSLLASQKLTRDDVVSAVANCQNFAIRPGIVEAFQLAHRRGIPIIVVSAGLGNIIEEVIRQRISKPLGTSGEAWPNVRVLSNTLQWDERGNFAGFSEPLIHMYNKSLQDAPAEIRQLLDGRHVGILTGDGTGDLTMAHGHDATDILKFGFLNEKVEERLPKYTGCDAYDRVILNDGSFEPVLDLLRRL
jgi:5'-nucleotidase